MRHVLLTLSLLIATFQTAALTPNEWESRLAKLAGKRSGVYAITAHNKILVDYHGDTLRVPASVTKLITAAAALHLLGPEFRFPTDIYYDRTSRNLWIKGYGNPIFFSEDLAEIAQRIRGAGIRSIQNLYLDNSYFASPILIPNHSGSDNPSDHYTGALSVDFNVANIQILPNGVLRSQNPITPITADVRQRAARFKKPGKYQISLTDSERTVLRYFGDLFSLMLQEQNVTIKGEIKKETVPLTAPLLFTSKSRQTLRHVVKEMLHYSTNTSANHIFLILGAQAHGEPATLGKGRKVIHHFLAEQFGIHDSYFSEGSGLSHENKIRPADVARVLAYLEPHADLLPAYKKEGVLAKTGTIDNVYTLAGVFDSPRHGKVRFAIMLNQRIDGLNHERMKKRRFEIVELLKANL